nr:hypothetical protein [Aneurinibacillus sp. XH2]
MKTPDLNNVIRPVRNRLWKQNIVRMALIGLLIGLCAACLWGVAGWLAPVAGYRWGSLFWIGMAVTGSVTYALWRRTELKEAAQVMDQGGLEERMTTALAFEQQDSPIAAMQREDALRYGEEYIKQLRSKLPYRWEMRWLIANGTALVVLAALLLLPNPMDEVVEARSKEKAWTEARLEEARQQLEEWKKADPSSEITRGMEQTLERLETGLKETANGIEALEKLEQALKETQKLAQTEQKKLEEAADWAERMEKQEALRQLGEALRNQDSQELEEAVRQLHEQVKQMSEAERKQLAEQLEALAESAPAHSAEAEQAQEALRQLASQLQSGPNGEGAGAGLDEEQLAQLQEALAKLMQQQLQAQQLLAQLQQSASQLAQPGLALAQQLAAQGIALPTTWGANGLASSLASGNGQGALPGSSGAGQGSGSQGGGGQGGGSQGSGSQGSGGQGSGGQGGGGQGSGGQGSGGQGGGGQGGGGQGGLAGGTGSGSRSMISTPRTPDGGGTPTSDQGPLNGRGGEIEKGGQAPVLDGASRPYEEVYSEYAAEATQSLNRSQLPQSMQNLVRDYFTEIQPNR